MADVAVENPANIPQPHQKKPASSIPNVEDLEGTTTDNGDEFSNFKKLKRQLEYVKQPLG
jgi:26S proteasome regulatory subunit T3